MKRLIAIICALALSLAAAACTGAEKTRYSLTDSFEVDGRQGVAYSSGNYIVSGSTTLTKYDKDFNVVAENKSPFADGYDNEVNHIGDIDVYGGEIYCGVELFLDGVATNIQIAVYDADALTLKRTFNFEESSGQTECSGIAVNPDEGLVVMCSWEESEAGGYLYVYELTGAYVGKVRMDPQVKYIQGIAYYDGSYYITADDGDADANAPDHVYKTTFKRSDKECKVYEELTLTDVKKQGEIEGLTFDPAKKRLAVLYNRGARIIRGMPTGFYEGYEKEIHEVYFYLIS